MKQAIMNRALLHLALELEAESDDLFAQLEADEKRVGETRYSCGDSECATCNRDMLPPITRERMYERKIVLCEVARKIRELTE